MTQPPKHTVPHTHTRAGSHTDTHTPSLIDSEWLHRISVALRGKKKNKKKTIVQFMEEKRGKVFWPVNSVIVLEAM